MNWKPKKEVSFEKLLLILCKYCSYQDRCVFEVEQKLNSYYVTPDDKDRLIDYLIEERFLDESRFLESFVKSKFKVKKWGKIKITQHLKQKKINAQSIEQALSIFIKEEDYTQVIAELGTKKWASLEGEEHLQKKAKTLRYLASKGFELENIYRFLGEIA